MVHKDMILIEIKHFLIKDQTLTFKILFMLKYIQSILKVL